MSKNLNNKLVVYCGKDNKFFSLIAQRMEKSYEQINFEFLEVFEDEDIKFEKLYKKFLDKEVTFFYIDFSESFETQSRLALTLKRVSAFRHIPIVGLIPSRDYILKVESTMADFIHIKCGEQHDLVYDPFVLGFPSQAINPGFAKARSMIDINLNCTFRVCYVTETYIRVEGNLLLKKGEVVELKSSLTELHFESNNYGVREVYTNNLYYDYKYGYDLDLVFLDPPIEETPEDDSEREEMTKRYREQISDYDIRLKKIKKDHKTWLLDNLEKSSDKKPKILIFDPLFEFMSGNSKAMDSYPHLIRCETELTEDLNIVEVLRPDIIALQFFLPETDKEYESEEVRLLEENEEYNNIIKNNISKLLQKVDQIGNNYRPYVLIFRSETLKSEDLQSLYNYPSILCNTGKVKLDYIAQVSQLYLDKTQKEFEEITSKKILELRAKDYQKYGRLTVSDFVEKKYCFSKLQDLSFASVSLPITVKLVSESEIVFQSKEELEFSNYSARAPVDMQLRIVPISPKVLFETDADNFIYRALIHGIDEDAKKTLRQQVNDIYTEPKREEAEKEKKAFEEINQKVLQERQEQEVIETGGTIEKPEEELGEVEKEFKDDDLYSHIKRKN